jgi:long-chain acyl-CoA synthetase
VSRRAPTDRESIGAILEAATAEHASHCAVVCGGDRVSYGELSSRCRRLVAALRGLGLEVGDRVGVVAENCHRYLELYLAVPAAGMVLVPLNRRLTKREIDYALRDSGTEVLFTDRPELGGPGTTLIDLRDRYEGLLAAAEEASFPRISSETLAGLFYTSGTTGAAKGVMLSHANLAANTATWYARWPFGRDTRWLLIAPLFHLAGTNAVLATVAAGGRHIVLPSFGAAGALELIAAEGATATLVIPTMLAAMADEQLQRPRRVSSLVHLSHGGAPIATETLRRAHRAFPHAELMNIYGTTETAPNVTFLPEEEKLLDSPVVRSSGRAVDGAEIAVVDASGARQPAGEVGEVIVRGPMVMKGYWNKPDATAAALKAGWYYTGDLGRIDADGYLYLVDRRRDMIVTGGENVYSTEVEEVLYRHPKVLEAAVFGVPDAQWGEAVHAVVVLREPLDDEGELAEHCRGQIAGFKVPKAIEISDAPLPKSGAGKILKRELRAPFWAGRTEQISGA